MFELCLSTGAVAYANAYFGQGTGPVWLSRVQCLGNETTLTNCTHATINNCGHHDDAGVSCIGKITLLHHNFTQYLSPFST